MLKQRLLAALVLMPLVIWGILALPHAWFAAVTALVILAGAWEWARLIPMKALSLRLSFLVLVAGMMWMLWPALNNPGWLGVILGLAVAWWIFALIWFRFPRLGTGVPAIKFLVALLVLVPAWGALNALHLSGEQGPALVLFVVALMWVADSGAYFAGRSLGKHKLAPSISPGKTWEGVFGGLVACAIYAVLAANWLTLDNAQLYTFVALTLLTAAISVAGDLFISLLKRQEGLKDTGHLIPGHGGILDRIDSLLAAAPVFLFGFGVLGL